MDIQRRYDPWTIRELINSSRIQADAAVGIIRQKT